MQELDPDKEIISEEERENRLTHVQENHSAITQAYWGFINENNRMPTYSWVAEETGLALNTVRSHLKSYKEKDLKQQVEKFKIFSDDVLLGQIKRAVEGGHGSTDAAKLYYQIVHNFKPGLELSVKKGTDYGKMTLDELTELQKQKVDKFESKLLRLARDRDTPS